MIFLIVPKGKVTRAWLPQNNDIATVGRVQVAIVVDIGCKYENVKVFEGGPARPSHQAYYGQHYIETGVTNAVETFGEIMGAK